MGEFADLLAEIKRSPRPLQEKRVYNQLVETMTALVDAESIDDVRRLQGKAKAYRAFLKYNEEILTLAASEKDDSRA